MTDILDIKTLLNDIHELHETLREANSRVALAEGSLKQAFPELDDKSAIEAVYRMVDLSIAGVALEDCWGIADDLITKCEELSKRLINVMQQVIA